MGGSLPDLLGKAWMRVGASSRLPDLVLRVDSDATPPRPRPIDPCRSRPHYRGEQPGLAEEPDGYGGGGEASLAPWPGLNIYYVLFGLWGRGGEGCRIDLELPGGPRGEGNARPGGPKRRSRSGTPQHTHTHPGHQPPVGCGTA